MNCFTNKANRERETQLPDHRVIYDQHAEQYEQLVSRLDYQNNILRALTEIHPLEGRNVVELGAGTGKVTRILAPLVDAIWLFDVSHHMLGVAARALETEGSGIRGIAVADHRYLPVISGVADIVISGWSVCYLAVWSGEEWRGEVGKALREMERVLQHEGTIILLEGLGTGYERPQPPEKLKAYYEYLEQEGFCSRWIRTDYEFESLEQAKELLEFFFGKKLAGETVVAMVEGENWVRLPVCTGIWWKSLPDSQE